MPISIDFSRGVDVFRGRQLLKHFTGDNAMADAQDYARAGRGRYIRYWSIVERD